MNAPLSLPPFPPNPTFGQRFGNWVWNGSRWVCTGSSGLRIATTVFNASAPYTPAPGLMYVEVEAYGGGGGGGGAGPAPSALYMMSGGGGGSGGYSRATLAAALVAGGVNVTIGLGGLGGVPPCLVGGAQGGATTFGAMVVAIGGLGGGTAAGVAGAYAGSSGNGANPGTGDLASPGASGTFGALVILTALATNTAQGALGGQINGGNRTTATETGGVVNGAPPVPNSAAGGTGGCVNQVNGGEAQGSSGATGLCIVTEYIWADAADDGCGCAPTSGAARVAIGWQGGGFDDE